MTIEENQGIVSQTKRAILRHPKIWQAIKLLLLNIGTIGLWSVAIKPIIQRAVNRICYPMFHIRHIDSMDASFTESSQIMAAGLGSSLKHDSFTVSSTKKVEYHEIQTEKPKIVTMPTTTLENDDEDDNENEKSFLVHVVN